MAKSPKTAKRRAPASPPANLGGYRGVAYRVGGAAVIETVFSWPGLGRLALEAVQGRDYNVLLGVLLLSSMLVIVANVLVDLLHAWLDPRIALH